MRRVDRIVVASPPRVVDHLAGCRRNIVVDVEGTLVAWNSPPRVVDAALKDFVRRVRAVGATGEIIFVSNAHFDPVVQCPADCTLILDAHKPYKRHRSFTDVAFVVGDQVVTDGLLAWRLHATFVEIQTSFKPPLWPRLQKRFGSIAVPFCFR